MNGLRNFISFTDDLKDAVRYSMIDPAYQNPEKATYSMLIGISPNDLPENITSEICSDIPELGIIKSLSRNYIKFIAVPNEKIEEVKKQITNRNLSIDVIDLSQMYMSLKTVDQMTFGGRNTVRNCNDLIKDFSKNQVKQLAKTRKSSKIQRLFNSIKNIFYDKNKVEEKSRNE